MIQERIAIALSLLERAGYEGSVTDAIRDTLEEAAAIIHEQEQQIEFHMGMQRTLAEFYATHPQKPGW